GPRPRRARGLRLRPARARLARLLARGPRPRAPALGVAEARGQAARAPAAAPRRARAPRAGVGVSTLLTGATGYLGGYALFRLLERGERVVALVRARDDAEARARLWTALDLHLPRDTRAAAEWLRERFASGQ